MQLVPLRLALEQGLTIIPVANKVDMDNADVPRVTEQMSRAFGTEPDELVPVGGLYRLIPLDTLVPGLFYVLFGVRTQRLYPQMTS
jgi:hypothetical protein